MSRRSKSSRVTAKGSGGSQGITAPVLRVLLEGHRRPRGVSTGLEGLQHAALRRQGAVLLQGSVAEAPERSEEEVFEDFVESVQPLVAGWSDLDKAILALRALGGSVRDIKRELGASGERICRVIQAVRRFYDGDE